MNCGGCRQRFLPVPDLSRKIEGDSVRRVQLISSQGGKRLSNSANRKTLIVELHPF